MRLAYIDESYTRDFYFIAAVVVDDASAQGLHRALSDVADKAQQAYLPATLSAPATSSPTSPAAPLELHGYPLFHGDGDWAPIKHQTRALVSVYDQAMQAIGSQDVQIILRGLDVKRLKARYTSPEPEHALVLQHTLERLNDLGRRVGEQVLVIADEIDDPNRHRAQLHAYRQAGTPGYRSSKLDHILDTIHFVPSQHSRLVQAADLVAFLHRRRMTVKETNPKQAAAIERIWGHVAGRVDHQLTWLP